MKITKINLLNLIITDYFVSLLLNLIKQDKIKQPLFVFTLNNKLNQK